MTQKSGHSQNTNKTKMQKKTDNLFQLAQLCSQIVFLILEWAKKATSCWKHYKNGCFSIVWKRKMAKKWQQGWVKHLSKVESNICPSMLRNRIWQIVDSKNGNFCHLSPFFWNISFSLQKEEYFWKTKRKKEKKKAKFWTDFWLYSIAHCSETFSAMPPCFVIWGFKLLGVSMQKIRCDNPPSVRAWGALQPPPRARVVSRQFLRDCTRK